MGGLYVTSLCVAAVSFHLFLNWYDTGQLIWDQWWVVASGTALCAGLGYGAQVWRNRSQGEAGARLLWLILSQVGWSWAIIMVGVFSFAIVYDAVARVNPAGLLVLPFIAAFYAPMAIPFGLVAGLVTALIMRVVLKLS